MFLFDQSQCSCMKQKVAARKNKKKKTSTFSGNKIHVNMSIYQLVAQ